MEDFVRNPLRLFTALFALCLWAAVSLSLARTRADAQGGTDQQSLAKQASDLYVKNWVEQDVAYITTDEEQFAFQRVTNNDERFSFIEWFWIRRDPTPKTVENEVKQEHYRRLAYANRKFTSDVPGWRTDRGMIYVLLGPPDRIELPPPSGSTASKLFSEIWHYSDVPGLSTGQEAVWEFVDKSRNGNYRLIMDPAAEALLDRIKARIPWEESLVLAVHRGPQIEYKDLQTVLNVKMSYGLLPFRCQATFERVTDATVLTTIGIQIQDKDLTYREEYGSMLTTIRMFGRVTDSLGRLWETFEAERRAGGPKPFLKEVIEGASYSQKTVPLKAGQYRLELVLKDLNSGNLGTLYQSIVVPDQK